MPSERSFLSGENCEMTKLRRQLHFPHPMVLLLGGVLLAAALTWVLPAGAYERRIDPDSSRERVVAGTYGRVDASPVGIPAALMAVPRGIVSGADVIVVILFVGGAYAMLDRTGALARLVAALLGRTRRPRSVVLVPRRSGFDGFTPRPGYDRRATDTGDRVSYGPDRR